MPVATTQAPEESMTKEDLVISSDPDSHKLGAMMTMLLDLKRRVQATED